MQIKQINQENYIPVEEVTEFIAQMMMYAAGDCNCKHLEECEKYPCTYQRLRVELDSILTQEKQNAKG